MNRLLKHLCLTLLTFLCLITSFGQTVYATTRTDELNSIFKEASLYDPEGGVCSTDGSTAPAPTSSKLFVIGDSLTVGMVRAGGLLDKLKTAGYDVDPVVPPADKRVNNRSVEATEGIRIEGTIPLLAAHAGDIAAAGKIVIGLGTNTETDFSGKIQSLISAVRSYNASASLYWINTYYQGSSISPSHDVTNQVIETASKTDDAKYKFTVIDLASAVASDSTLAPNASDKIHYNGGGYASRAAYITGALGNLATAPSGVAPSASGDFITTYGGAEHKLSAKWIPILNNAGARFGIDSSLLAGIMSVESNWRDPEFYTTNPLRNSATATGAFQIIDMTSTALMPMPDAWTGDEWRNKPHTSNTVKAAVGGDKEPDGSYIVDANKDNKVDRATPEDAAYMSAALLKTLGASTNTPLGLAGDYGVARNNEDGKVTIRTIAAHYNQGGGWSSGGATTKEEANARARGGNKTGDYMDHVMTVTQLARESGFFTNTTTEITPGDPCGTTTNPAKGIASQYIPDCSANEGNAALACTAVNQLMGVPYSKALRAGPKDPDPKYLDCSALTGMAVYRTFGVDLKGMCSMDYLSNANFVEIDVKDIKPGDFVGKGTVCGVDSRGVTGHIGIVVSYDAETKKLITVEASSEDHPSGLRGIGGTHGYNVGIVPDGNGGKYEWAVRYVGPKTVQPGAL